MKKNGIIILFALVFFMPLITLAGDRPCRPESKVGTSFDYAKCIEEGGDLGDIFKSGSPGNTRWVYCQHRGSACEFGVEGKSLEEVYNSCIAYASNLTGEAQEKKLNECEVLTPPAKEVLPPKEEVSDCSNLDMAGLGAKEQKEKIANCLGIKFDSGSAPGTKPSYCGKDYYTERINELYKIYNLDLEPGRPVRARDAAYHEKAKFYSCMGTPCEWYKTMTQGEIEEKILSCYGVKVEKTPVKPLTQPTFSTKPIAKPPEPIEVKSANEGLIKEMLEKFKKDLDNLEMEGVIVVDENYCKKSFYPDCVNSVYYEVFKDKSNAERRCKPLLNLCLKKAQDNKKPLVIKDLGDGGKSSVPTAGKTSCSSFKRVVSFLPDKGFIADFKKAVGVDKCPTSEEEKEKTEEPEDQSNNCSLGPNSRIIESGDRSMCICNPGYERVTAKYNSGEISSVNCLSITRTEKDLGKYMMSDSVTAIQEAIGTLQEKAIGENEQTEVTTATGENVKIKIIKTGLDTYQYTTDGIRYYDYLPAAISSSNSSVSESSLFSSFSRFFPYNWGKPVSGDGTSLVPTKDYSLISKIQSNIDRPVYDSIVFRKEFLVGAYEYIKARAKYSPRELLISGEQTADAFIEAAIPHIRNKVSESNFDPLRRFSYILRHGGQDTRRDSKNPIYSDSDLDFLEKLGQEGGVGLGGGPDELLSEEDLARKDVQQKAKIYAQYEMIYNRYKLAKELSE